MNDCTYVWIKGSVKGKLIHFLNGNQPLEFKRTLKDVTGLTFCQNNISRDFMKECLHRKSKLKMYH
jgi:hypothetical protein